MKARQLLALAIPVIVAQVAQTAMGFVDTVMAGGYSATDVAAVAIGTSIWLPAIPCSATVCCSRSPDLSLSSMARVVMSALLPHQIRQGFWLAGFVFPMLIMVVLWNADTSFAYA